MSLWRISAIGLVVALSLAGAPAASWLSNFDVAKASAAANNRPILMNFTGSDWCPACQQMRTSVFSSQDFDDFANGQLVLMEVDFPRSTPLAALHLQANQQLGRRYQVSAFPTLLLVTATGDVIGQIQNTPTAPQFIAALNGMIASARNSGKLPKPAERSGPLVAPPAPVRDLPLFSGATTQPLPVYTNLIVKNISGSAGKRFALINSETMVNGEAAWLKINGGKVRVQCVEVREKSVVVRIDGEPAPRELLLSER